MTRKTAETAAPQQDARSNLPTHIAKVRHGYGKNATYERIGVAWTNEDGSFYVKLYGTQVVSAFSLYEIAADENAEAGKEKAGE